MRTVQLKKLPIEDWEKKTSVQRIKHTKKRKIQQKSYFRIQKTRSSNQSKASCPGQQKKQQIFHLQHIIQQNNFLFQVSSVLPLLGCATPPAAASFLQGMKSNRSGGCSSSGDQFRAGYQRFVTSQLQRRTNHFSKKGSHWYHYMGLLYLLTNQIGFHLYKSQLQLSERSSNGFHQYLKPSFSSRGTNNASEPLSTEMN